MANTWKKWLTYPGGIRVVLALLYLLATFGIPLNHICKLSDKDVHNHHSKCSSHQLQSDSYVEVHHTAFNQNNLSDKTDSHDLYCPACLYSLSSKTFRACSNVSLCSTQTVIKTQILPQLSFIKQLEWFCSTPLRAPPCITSKHSCRV